MIRLGYVTNSSSTQHIIAWKGKKEDLFDLLVKHIGIFLPKKSHVTIESMAKYIVLCLESINNWSGEGEGITTPIEFIRNCLEFGYGGTEDVYTRIDRIANMNFVANIGFGESCGEEDTNLDWGRDECVYEDDDIIHIIVNHH